MELSTNSGRHAIAELSKTPTEIRIYKATVVTILVLHGAEVWNTCKKQLKRFEVIHLTSLRRILKIKSSSMSPTRKFSGELDQIYQNFH